MLFHKAGLALSACEDDSDIGTSFKVTAIFWNLKASLPKKNKQRVLN